MTDPFVPGVGGAPPCSRRRFLGTSLLGIAGVLWTGCGAEPRGTGGATNHAGARISARPGAPTEVASPGLHDLSGRVRGRCLLYLPEAYDPDVGAPLLMLLHGAGPSRDSMGWFTRYAEAHGVILVLPYAASHTWDMLLGRFGPDVRLLDRALATVFARCRVPPEGVAIGGFSDGATYALSIGLSNGDLFRRVVALSPGYLDVLRPVGKPDVFLAHGVRDEVFPIASTSRLIAGQLHAAGHRVDYTEFDGPHTVPPDQADAAFGWVAAGTRPEW